MRKITLTALLIAVGMLMVSTAAFAAITAAPGTGIKGSAHDLSFATGQGLAWGVAGLDPLDRICIFCHAPHHAYKLGDPGALDYYPLWNHAVAAGPWTGYSNTDPAAPVVPGEIKHQLNAGVDGQILGQPGGVSKMCLSCHDGTLAVAQYGFAPSSSIGSSTGPRATPASRIFIGGGAAMLTNHHPIGFDYGAVIAAGDTEIRGTGSPLIGSSRGMTIDMVLWGGKVECTSCHDVHNTQNDGLKLLWVEDTGSALCFSCHAK